MKNIFLAALSIFIFLLPVSAEARKYSRSFSGFHQSHSIFGKKSYGRKQVAAPLTRKSVFEPRPKFRKGTTANALHEAPRNHRGEIVCPTCDRKITGQKVNGRRDFDLDHNPPWSKKKSKMQQIDPPPTRAHVRDEYQKDVRVQCPGCNRSHRFEGQTAPAAVHK